MDFFLTIAASDSSGGAGIQQDLNVAKCFNFWGLSAITGITAQNFHKVSAVEPTSPQILQAQLDEIVNSFSIKAIKIGAICSTDNLNIIIDFLKKAKIDNVVLDTVLASTLGFELFEKKGLDLLKKYLFPLVKIITPNKSEFEILSGEKCYNLKKAIDIAVIKGMEWNTAIFLKGGHFDTPNIQEAIIDNGKVLFFERERNFFKYQHGTGCTISSALACTLTKHSAFEIAYTEASNFLINFYKEINKDL